MQEEEFIQAINGEFENARRKKDENEQQLAKYNVNDRELNEQNVQIDEEIKGLQELILVERRKLEAERMTYKQTMDQVSNFERNVKKLEARTDKIKKTISTLEESIQTELNS